VFQTSQNGILSDSTTTSVRYDGKTYTLYSVQLTDPTHNNWIIPASAHGANSEDIILTFSYSTIGSGPSQYLVFVVPILRTTSVINDPSYLSAIGTASITNPISLQSLIPSDPSSLFAYYSTCSPAATAGQLPQSILNIIAVGGLQVSDTTMARIKGLFIKTSASSATTYGGYIAPITINYSNTPTTIKSITQFNQMVNSTQNILVPPTAGVGPVAEPVEDTIDAYKCVPFDPEHQLVNGKITINSNDGTLLSTIQADREAVMDQGIQAASALTPAIYTKYVSYALAFFMTLIIFVILIYFCIGAAVGTTAVGHGAGYFQRSFKAATNVPTYLVIGILCGFTGFMIGMIIKYR
jgi:hypothetical protein